jgi:hypothetical protein
MASNYEKEPIFVLERTWDDSMKLTEKYKFQGRKNGQKAEICIDSGTLEMEFFLDQMLPQFNQAGAKLDWGWPEMFLEFENILGDSYRTTHHLPALIYGFSGGKKIFPATKESYRVYIGISSLKADSCAY